MDPREARIEELEAELAAARRTIDALVRRAEREARGQELDQVAVRRSMTSLEEAVLLRNRALVLSEAHFRALWNECPDMLVTLDAKGVICERNAAARAAGLKGRLAEHVRDPSLLERVLEGGVADLHLADGRPVHLSCGSISEELHLVVLHDLSVYQMLEEELQVARRLALIGELASAVSHEINEPLSIILGRLELLDALGDDVEPGIAARHYDLIEDHARRIALIVANLQVFARPEVAERTEVAVAELLMGAREASGRRVEEIEVVLDVDPPELTLPCDRVQIEQVLAALMLNAADAMGRRGQIRITARLDRRYVRIDVRDQGTGVPPGLRDRLRGLSAPGRGTAFGMSVAAGIVRSHGGRLSVVEDTNRGATYRIELPAGAAEGVEPVRAKVLVVDPRGGDTSSLAGMLRDGGHHVQFCTTLGQALSAVESEKPDAVLCARYLPGLGGRDVRDLLGTRNPGIAGRVVLLLGAKQPPPAHGLWLRPPFSTLDVDEVLRQVLVTERVA